MALPIFSGLKAASVSGRMGVGWFMGVGLGTRVAYDRRHEGIDHKRSQSHLCLKLATKLGLLSARSSIQTFDGVQAIVVERYDREWTSESRWVRLHQEDACQALAVGPTLKYENEGGPGIPELADLLDEYSTHPGAEVLEAVPAAANDAAHEVRAEGATEAILDRLEGAIIAHSRECLDRLVGGSG